MRVTNVDHLLNTEISPTLLRKRLDISSLSPSQSAASVIVQWTTRCMDTENVCDIKTYNTFTSTHQNVWFEVSRCKQQTMPLDLPSSLRSKWFVYFACFLKFNATVVYGHAWIGEILLSVYAYHIYLSFGFILWLYPPAYIRLCKLIGFP